MKAFTTLTLSLLILSLNSLAATYQCQSQDGHTSFQSKPCPKDHKQNLFEQPKKTVNLKSITGNYYESLDQLVKQGFEDNLIPEEEIKKNKEMYEEFKIITKGAALKKYSRIMVLEHKVNQCSQFKDEDIDGLHQTFLSYMEANTDNIIVGREIFAEGYSFPAKNFEISSKELNERTFQGLAKIDQEFNNNSTDENRIECTQLSKTLKGALQYGM